MEWILFISTHTHSTVLASSILSTVLAPSASSIVLSPTVTVSQPTSLLPTVPPSTLPVSQSLTHSPAFSVSLRFQLSLPSLSSGQLLLLIAHLLFDPQMLVQHPDKVLQYLFFSRLLYILYYTNFTKTRVCTVYHYLL